MLRAADPPKSYREISDLLGMAVGSVGPKLRRSLDRLGKSRAMRAYLASTASADGKTRDGETRDGETGGDQRELAEVE